MMPRKRILLLLLLLFLIPVQALAESFINPTTGVITSPFGPRESPTEGASSFHKGIDIAGELNDPVNASAGGIVEYAGWADGYGNVIYIRHADGYETRYAHLNEIGVTVGQSVAAGETIGWQGNTGIGTGVHLHFEIRDPFGNAIDPATMVPDLGAYVSGYGPSSPEGRFVKWELLNDFANPIKEILDGVVELITKGLKALQDYVAGLFFVLCLIDIAVGAMGKVLSPTSEDKEGLVPWLIRRCFFYGFCLVFLYNWKTFIGNLSLHGFPVLGGMIGGDVSAANTAVSDPTQIVQKGMSIVAPIVNSTLMARGSIFDMFFGSILDLVCLVIAAVLFILFLIIGYQIALAYISFYASVLFSFTSFPLSGLRYVRHFAANGVNGVIACSINLMFFCFFAAALQMTMASFTVPALVSNTAVYSSTPATRAGASTGADITGPEDYVAMAREAARHYGIPEDLFCAQIQAESGWDPNAVSSAGAQGIAQFMPDTAASFGIDPFNPAEALEAAAQYDRSLYDALPDDKKSWDLMFAAYNMGGAGLANRGYDYSGVAETVDYVAKIFGTTEIGKGMVRGTVQKAANIGLMLQVLLIVLLFMYMADRISRLVLDQFGSPGFRLYYEQGIFSRG